MSLWTSITPSQVRMYVSKAKSLLFVTLLPKNFSPKVVVVADVTTIIAAKIMTTAVVVTVAATNQQIDKNIENPAHLDDVRGFLIV